MVTIHGETFTGTVSFDISKPAPVKQGNWGDYARGAKYALQKRFKLKKGITGSIRGSLPVGGLSSSAAVLIAYVMAFAKANNVILQPMELALIASEAEREYIGLNNGLLDQACIALGKKDHLLMLDCESNNYRLIPRNPSMPEFKLGIIFSGLTRSLMQSDYNLRVAECKTAAWNVQAYYDEPLKEQKLTFLRDVDKAKFEKVKDKMPPRFARRAEHFYSEYKRVREAVSAWEMGDLEWFGKLSFESCESSIHNYECGSPELIEIYKAMRETDGIYGGRFSGAGFKGACLAICDPDKLDRIRESITQKYLARFPQYKNSFMCTFVDTDNGARFV
jgi:galactokinase/galacturonokinase